MGEQSPLLTRDAGSTIAQRPAVTIVAILAAVFLLGMGNALQATALALRGGLAGFSNQVIGLVMSAYFIGFAVGSLFSVRIIRQVGYVRTFAAFASLSSITALSHILIINPVAWIVLRAFHGLCLASMLVVVESWLNASTASYNRGRVLSVYSLVYLASMGAGQPLIAVFSPATFEIFAVTSILISACLVPITLAPVTGTPVVDRSEPHLWKTFLRSPLGGIGIVISGISAEAIWGLAPRFGQQMGFSEARIGTLMLTVSLGALAVQFPLGWLSDRWDRRVAILLAAGIGSAAAGLMAFLHGSGFLFFMLAFLFGAFCMPLYSLCMALINDELTPGQMVQAASALVIYYGVGSATGPYVASIFMSAVGPSGLFLFVSAVLMLFVIGASVRVRARPRPEAAHAEHYHPYPRTTFAAFELVRNVTRRRRGAAMRKKNRENSVPPRE